LTGDEADVLGALDGLADAEFHSLSPRLKCHGPRMRATQVTSPNCRRTWRTNWVARIRGP
jgi:hypothetical protein